MAAAQKQAEEAAKAKAGAKPAPKPEEEAAAKAKAAKAEAAKTEAAKAEVAKAEVAKAEQKAEAPKAEPAAAPEQPKPAPKPKVVAPPPPSLMDDVMDVATNPLYLGTGGGVIALGGLAFWMVRRRRSQAAAREELPKAAPVLGKAPAAMETTMAMPAAPVAAPPAVAAAAAVEEVDPLAEAEVYIAYGRDSQAEEILKEALAKTPNRQDVQLKLLEIYSARKDKGAFNKVASDLHKQTGGAGDGWLAAAAMGYALDPANPLYEAGKSAAPAAPAPGAVATTDLDFELGGETAGVATDITLDSGLAAQVAAHETTAVLDAGELQSMVAEAQKAAEQPSAPLMPDFTLEIPTAGPAEAPVTKTDIALDIAAPTQDSHMIDFQIELPKAEAPETAAPGPSEAPVTDVGLDFKLDIPDLDVGAKAAEAAPAAEKDANWHDVQTKFDLAKAYQEMGDKEGAREILQEVIKEGDPEQQEQARKVLESLA
jgi:pilus assembly protein FimV